MGSRFQMIRRLDNKWAQIDLQKVLDPDGVAQLWNEMVQGSEIYGSLGLSSAPGPSQRGSV